MMNIPLLEILERLSYPVLILLAFSGLFLLYLTVARRVPALFFLLIFGAAFVGSSIPILADLSSLSRWIVILLMLVCGLLLGRIKIYTGMLFFLAYAVCGLLFVFAAPDIVWQAQRGILLLVTALAITTIFGDKDLETHRRATFAAAIVAVLVSIYGFVPLLEQLNVGARYFGYFQKAPNFAMTLGALLPFALWGMLEAKKRPVQFFFGAGFLLGAVALFFSGQRAGMIAGFVSVLPLLFLTLQQSGYKKALLIVGALVLVLVVFAQFASLEKIAFLQTRYSLDSGLSYRGQIWLRALWEISKNPLWGMGTGASENLISSSFHNTYLEVWFNAGAPGLVLYLFAQLYFVYRVIILWAQSAPAKSMLALTAGYLAGFIALGLVESVGAAASTLNLMLYLFLGAFVSNDGIFQHALVPRAIFQARREVQDGHHA